MRPRSSNIPVNQSIRFVFLILTVGFTMAVFQACGPTKRLPVKREYVTDSGLKYVLTKRGEGTTISSNDLVVLHYEARLENGTVFDSSRDRGEPLRIRMGSEQLFPGLKEGLMLLRAGDHARLFIPAVLAYGNEGYGPVPPDTDLIYQVEVIQVIQIQETPDEGIVRKRISDSGLEYIVMQDGDGPPLKRGMLVKMHYTGFFEDYTVFDSSYERAAPVSLIIGQGMVIPGLEESLLYLKVGDKARVWVPYQLAYGEKGRDPIPARSDLIFDIHITEAEMINLPALEAVNEEDIITTESGLRFALLEEGRGALPKAGQLIKVHYSGFLSDGTLFDSSEQRGEPVRFVLGAGQLIPGLEEGFALMRAGSRAQLIVPPELAYGDKGRGPVPPGETLTFDVKLIAIEP